jgi:hypothetical protein
MYRTYKFLVKPIRNKKVVELSSGKFNVAYCHDFIERDFN